MPFVYMLQSCMKAFLCPYHTAEGNEPRYVLVEDCIGSDSPSNPSAMPLCVGGELECVVHHKMSIYVWIVLLLYIIHQGDVKR